jgi:hypothetical protein
MPSNLPRLNVVMAPAMRQWLEDQRQPCESAAHVVRRLITQAMEPHPTHPQTEPATARP